MWYIEIWQSPRNNQWYWHMVATNSKILSSSEGYTRKASCERTARAVCERTECCDIIYRKVKPKKKNRCPHKRTFGVDIDSSSVCRKCNILRECHDHCFSR